MHVSSRIKIAWSDLRCNLFLWQSETIRFNKDLIIPQFILAVAFNLSMTERGCLRDPLHRL